MEIGFGVLRLSPEAFYSMTIPELSAAVAGWSEAHGGAPSKPDHQKLSARIRAAFTKGR